MSADPYLTDDQVESITKPLTQGAARIKFFRKLGCNVKPKPNRQPLVGRADFEAAMLAKQRKQAPTDGAKVIRPDWASLRGFKSA